MPELNTFALLVADIYQAAGELRRNGEAIAQQAGQSQARWQVMSVASEGDWTVPDIARRLGVARQGVQRIADELLEARLAVLADNPRHRRSSLLRLSAAGKEALARITAVARRSHQKWNRHFKPEEIEAARRVMRRIVEVLEQDK